MSNTGNFFSGLWNVIKKAFSPGAVRVEASIADMVLPEFGPLINTAASAIIAAEGTATAAGFQTGTGAQKLGIATTLFQGTYNDWAAKNGLVQEPAAVQNILQNMFNLLQGLNLISTAQPVQVVQGGAANAPASSVSTQAKSGTLL